jgi:peptidoglycan/xylan/chitin deacetylase (PgdA/CDA1 family)
MYHSVAARSSPAFQPYCLEPGLFAEHMSALASSGYRTLTVTELTELRASGDGVPPRSVVLTFDDAFADFREHALEVLTRHRFTATLYVPTAFVGATSRWLSDEGECDRRMLGWAELAEIATAGIEIGSHSHSHLQLDLLPPDVLREELTESRWMLEDRLQERVSSLAYPFGFHTSRVRQAARNAGYRSACAVRDLTSTSADDPFAVNRLVVSGGTSVQTLLDRVATPTGRVRSWRADARAHASRTLRRARGGKRRISASTAS